MMMGAPAEWTMALLGTKTDALVLQLQDDASLFFWLSRKFPFVKERALNRCK